MAWPQTWTRRGAGAWYRRRMVRRRYDYADAGLNLKVFRPLPGQEREEFNEEIIRSYLDAFLMDAEEFEFSLPERSLKNPTVVD